VAFPRKLLNEDEHVVVSTRTHVKALLVPAFWLIVLAAAAGFASSFASGSSRSVVLLVIWVVALVLALWLVVVPFLRWLTTTYTVTDRRLITRTGILSRRGHDIPITRINDVAYEHGLLDRILGCGTLVVSDASERGQVRLPDIPDVERVHLQLSELLFHGYDDRAGRAPRDEERRLDDGT
jgi:membrane protein YdbS with pleckstrin-like domain